MLQFFSKVDNILFKIIFDLRVFQGIVNRSFHEAEFITYIVALAFKFTGKDSLGLVESVDRIRQLNFIASTWFLICKNIKDFRSQEVAPDDSEIAWSVLWLWFFYKVSTL